MALPPSSSISTAYERSSRKVSSSPTNNNNDTMLRHPHSRERFDDREYRSQISQHHDRSPRTNDALRRESMETAPWERSKPRDTTRYPDGK